MLHWLTLSAADDPPIGCATSMRPVAPPQLASSSSDELNDGQPVSGVSLVFWGGEAAGAARVPDVNVKCVFALVYLFALDELARWAPLRQLACHWRTPLTVGPEPHRHWRTSQCNFLLALIRRGRAETTFVRKGHNEDEHQDDADNSQQQPTRPRRPARPSLTVRLFGRSLVRWMVTYSFSSCLPRRARFSLHLRPVKPTRSLTSSNTSKNLTSGGCCERERKCRCQRWKRPLGQWV